MCSIEADLQYFPIIARDRFLEKLSLWRVVPVKIPESVSVYEGLVRFLANALQYKLGILW